jgi:hypothetical protein
LCFHASDETENFCSSKAGRLFNGFTIQPGEAVRLSLFVILIEGL